MIRDGFVTKTLTLRIIRPYYGDDIEKEIAEYKVQKVNQKGQIHHDDIFWNELNKKYPEKVSYLGLDKHLRQLQVQVSRFYNESMTKIYISKIINNEKGPFDIFFNREVYPKAMERFKNSYLVVGLGRKIKSNFRERELRCMQSSLPTAKTDNFPAVLHNSQDSA